MSRASEYAERLKTALKAPEFRSPVLKRWLAGVTDSGEMKMKEGTLLPSTALAFAAWILDTFGETPLETRPKAPACEHKDTTLQDQPARMVCLDCGTEVPDAK